MSTTLGQATQEYNLSQATPMIRNAIWAAQSSFDGVLTGVTPQNTPSKLVTILTAWSGAVRSVRSDSYASTPARIAAEKDLGQRAAQAITDLEHRYREALALYKATIANDLPAIDTDLHMKLWARLERQLNAGVRVEALIDEADAATLTVLSEELHSWRRVKMPDDLRGADFQFQGDGERIRVRRRAIATPEERARLDIVDAAAKGEYRLVISFQQARHALDFLTGFDVIDVEAVVPNWGDGEIFVKL